VGWALQHIHRLDEFCLQWVQAEKNAKFNDLSGFTSIIICAAINNCYQDFNNAFENAALSEFSALKQIQMFDQFIQALQNTVKVQRNFLTASHYKEYVRHLDQLLSRKPVPLLLEEFDKPELALIINHPHLKPKYKTEAGARPRYWVSFGVTSGDSLVNAYGHSLIVLSHQVNEKSEILIDQCAGYYSGAWNVFGAQILKPFDSKNAKFKPEKYTYMELPQYYKHWEITAEEFQLLDKEIKEILFKKGSFNVFNKSCKHTGMGLLKKINIFSPDIEGGILGFVPILTLGLQQGTMHECAIQTENGITSRDRFDCAPMIWSPETAVQLRSHADCSPGFLQANRADQKQKMKKS
jgi:hypothetical protein